MKLSYQQTTLRDYTADIAVVLAPDGKEAFGRAIARARKFAGAKLDAIIKLEEFTGKEGELVTIYSEGKLPTPRLFIIGLGQVASVNLESYRRAAAAAAKKAKSLHVRHVAFDIPDPPYPGKYGTVDIVRALAEGAALSVYKFDKYLTDKKKTESKISHFSFVGPEGEFTREIRKSLNEVTVISDAVFLARDLANAPANEIYPETLAASAEKSANAYGYRFEAWDKHRLEEEGFGGLLAVNSGSSREPRFIILEYNKGRDDLDTIVLVGKGITFDSGGISIKPSAGMGEMKMDMSGAATVIATLEAAARLSVPLHLVGLVPSTENMPSGTSMRPGDIIRHYKGKTSEVDNTDAEGRLVLADALGYAGEFNPAAVIDLATLTGACVVALGMHAAGMMGNNDTVMNRLKEAGDQVFERVWPLPLFEEYEKQIKSDVADVKNTGGRWAGAITAALFLKRFVGDFRWVHIDIAGPAILEEDLPYTPKGGSGFGVRLLMEFLKRWKSIDKIDNNAEAKK